MKTSEVRINDVAQIITGKTPPTVIKEYFGNKYPFITPSDIPTFRERRLREVERYLSDKGFSHQKKMLIPPNSPCFVAIGSTVGKMCLTNEDSFTNQQIHSLITQKGKADPFYLFYHLRYIYPWIKSIADARGSGKAIINKTDFGKIKINLPPLTIQKKIAAVLSTYDDLIENNNRRIAILEKMAEEIYREWFVRMRFPGHEKVRFHKGVPEGWEAEKLGNFINLIMGQSPKSEFYNTKGEGLPFNQGVGTYGYRFPKKQTFCSVNGRTAKKGDILFSVRAPVGRLNIADCKMIIGRGLSSINHKDGYNSYLYYMLKYYFSSEDIIGNGAIFNSVGKDELKKLGIIYPEESLIKQYDCLAAKIDSKIENSLNAMDILVKSRDLLLSRLLSGKLSVENLDIKFPPSMEEADA